MENGISDHSLIFIVLKLKLAKPQPKVINVRSYRHYERDKFLEELAQVQLENMLLMDDVDGKLDYFN